jgi:hypothetical protein
MCVDIEKQNMEARMREKRSLVLYNELNSNWKKELYIEVCTHEIRRRTECWKMGIRRLKSAGGNSDQGMCPMCSEEEGQSHILRCEGTRSWRDELADERFTSIDSEIGIRIAAKKKGQYLSKYKDKWKRLIKKYEDETVTNSEGSKDGREWISSVNRNRACKK